MTGIAMDPGGQRLYAASNAFGLAGSLAVFRRDIASGELTFLESFFDRVNGVDMPSPFGIVVSSDSPDSTSVYVSSAFFSSPSAISAFQVIAP